MEKILEWVKGNKVLAISAGALLALFAVMKMTKPARRRRRTVTTGARRRSVSPGARRYLRKAAGRPRTKSKRVYTKGGKAKKPWQVKGSIAARRHMARLRKMR